MDKPRSDSLSVMQVFGAPMENESDWLVEDHLHLRSHPIGYAAVSIVHHPALVSTVHGLNIRKGRLTDTTTDRSLDTSSQTDYVRGPGGPRCSRCKLYLCKSPRR